MHINIDNSENIENIAPSEHLSKRLAAPRPHDDGARSLRSGRRHGGARKCFRKCVCVLERCS